MLNITIDDFEILMSLYAGEKPAYFLECINSIEDDKFSPNVRLVIDGIINEDLEVILAGLNKEKWLIQRLQCNSGLAKALNAGVAASKKKYIIRLDTDDLWVKNRCLYYVSALQTFHGHIDVIGGHAELIDSSSKIYAIKTVPLEHRDIIKALWKCPFIHPSVAIRKEVLIQNPYRSTAGKRQDDYDLWFRLNNNHMRFLNIDKVLVKYRYTFENWSRNDISVAVGRIKLLLNYKGFNLLTLSVSIYLLLRSFLRFKWVYYIDVKLKNLL